MKRCIRIWFMGAGCLLIFISHNAQALWPFGSLKSIAWSGTKKVAKSVIPDNKIDSCLLGGSTLTLVAGIWMKSWLLDGCGAAGFGVYGYRRLTGMEVRIRADIKGLRNEYQKTSEELKTAIQSGNQALRKSLEDRMGSLEGAISTKIEALGKKDQELADTLKKELEGATAKLQEQIGGLEGKLNGVTTDVQTVKTTLTEMQTTGQNTQIALTGLQEQYTKDEKTRRDFEGTLFKRMDAVDGTLVQNTTAIGNLSTQMAGNTTAIQGLSEELVAATTVINEILDQSKNTEKRLQSVEEQNVQLLAEQKKQGTELTAIGKDVQTLVATVNALCRQGEQTGKDIRLSRNMIGAGILQMNGVSGVTAPFLPQFMQKQGTSSTNPKLPITGTPQ